jgi:DNA polymerase-1
MICTFDAKQLEWRIVANNSKDKVAIDEIDNGVDTHTDNQVRFKLPGWQVAGNGSALADEGRLIAKIFLFRAIFKGSAYAYSVDNDFKHIGGQKYWQGIIDKFYDKYQGIYKYHADLMREATSTGQIESITGRIYKFEPRMRRGVLTWPENDIVNYPVQGPGNDLMALARISAFNRLKEQRESGKVLFINTVHDNIVLDLNGGIKDALEIGSIVRDSFRSIPANFKKIYGDDFLVPMDSDCKVGINYLWGHKLKL